ncbi:MULTISPECIES: hypothetical protein [Catenuloplanes]|uniref:Uncharacterized protein n=2 Tax=Catenuloplanes TaxID=33874 RepID=A0AAE3YS28_9ACTN|nr:MULTISPECIES: hypothetical protein [Catenuloplanes]MDQ0366890.1 hypothetical protein [Catenuloplanes indicus]MDR7277606.1 hypothetical protein [Catenuloplanes atrovinosus]
MTAASARHGITRARDGARMRAAGRLFILLLLCALAGQTHALITCCAPAHTHTAAPAADGHAHTTAQPVAGHAHTGAGTAVPHQVFCFEHLSGAHECAPAAELIPDAALPQPDTVALPAPAVQHVPAPARRPALPATAGGPGRTRTELISLRI